MPPGEKISYSDLFLEIGEMLKKEFGFEGQLKKIQKADVVQLVEGELVCKKWGGIVARIRVIPDLVLMHSTFELRNDDNMLSSIEVVIEHNKRHGEEIGSSIRLGLEWIAQDNRRASEEYHDQLIFKFETVEYPYYQDQVEGGGWETYSKIVTAVKNKFSELLPKVEVIDISYPID